MLLRIDDMIASKGKTSEKGTEAGKEWGSSESDF
jgi:hypothetical protein